MAPNRRLFLASAAAVALAGCKPHPPGIKDGKAPSSLAKIIAGDWRPPADKARDAWRHPAESLAFWGLAPGMTVVEFWPGAGWYADILAPFLDATGGALYEALQPGNDPTQPASAQMDQAFAQKLKQHHRLYGDVHLTAFGPRSDPVAPAGSADLVLFLRNLHNWMAAGLAEKAFRDAYAALKPGGVLGIEEHRASPGGVQDPLAGDGYVQEAYVKQLAMEAGFVFDKASEINANPMDDHNHPFGVWTLPPTRRSAPAGKPDDPAFDHGPYDAVGESDRMTLRFTKQA